MPDRPDPLPCPFCGGAPAIRVGYSGLYWIECVNDECGAIAEAFDGKLEGVLERWNKRTEPKEQGHVPQKS